MIVVRELPFSDEVTNQTACDTQVPASTIQRVNLLLRQLFPRQIIHTSGSDIFMKVSLSNMTEVGRKLEHFHIRDVVTLDVID